MTSDQTIRAKHPSWEVPDFAVREYFKRKNEYAVCVFVINEGDRIHKQLEKMKKFSDRVDIIVADGGSSDGSLEDDFLKKTHVRTLLTKKGPGKLSAQMRMAFAYILEEAYDGTVVVDGNGKDDINAIPDFIRLLEEGFDHIQGSRFIRGGHAINTPLVRHLAVHFIHAPVISLAAGERHTDTTNGFRAYSSKLLKDPAISIFRGVFNTYELHYYLAIESSRRKYLRTIETPVTRRYPKTGRTPTKISPFKGNAKILSILFKAVLGRYKPHK
jgi:glycosyltransferase involved in cell wall biosynthesis